MSQIIRQLRYYKVLNPAFQHYTHKYNKGVNIDPHGHLFSKEGSCVKGGFYFTDKDNIFRYLGFGRNDAHIAFLTIPPDSEIVQDPDREETKWRSPKIFIDEIKSLNDAVDMMETEKVNLANSHLLQYVIGWHKKDVFEKLDKKNIIFNLSKDKLNELMITAADQGQLDMLMTLVEKYNANVHAKNTHALYLAGWCGHLDVAKYLIEKGADPRSNDAVRRAREHGHTEVVKFLQSKGAK
ncbi:MAG: ankyrin repeat protein [Terrestrivirus sp.]|jgi:hypothetical protein|uniref:Ankyrin repeat protein n=1 Tax=Terrestrivirus sp. TaxID=2487775 RepID=A0A3G4ZQ89_9VIRU|nr:MAG: ankyrin repeat protein [Terrestrivirus sp.]